MRRLLVALLFVVSGCMSFDRQHLGEEETESLRGQHPFPEGNEWPADLVGPFEFDLEELWIPSFDGTTLHAWLYLPNLPNGTKAPTVIWSSPYFDQTYPSGGAESIRTNDNAANSVPINLLVQHGYAVLVISVRGTGFSEGCFEMVGLNEQQDQAFTVEWVAEQEWSNGRVGMMGLSYHGTTPLEAAILNPPHLKTVVVAGIVTDMYTWYATPQGALWTAGPAFQNFFNGIATYTPFHGNWTGFADLLPARLCPEGVEVMTRLWADSTLRDRGQTYWDERRLIDKFPEVTTSVLLAHGFKDLAGHERQESAVWQSLRKARVWQLEGQWGHTFPNFNEEPLTTPARSDWIMRDWNARLLGWLDYWLKGQGDIPEGVGRVDFQDGIGIWRNSKSWPPSERREEALYFSGSGLDAQPSVGERRFFSDPATSSWTEALCQPQASEATHGLLYVSEPTTERVVVAGNPIAYVTLSSTEPGDLVAVHLVDLSPEFRCEDGRPTGVKQWGRGIADLRFYQGNFVGRDFPVATPQKIRIDILDFAEVLDPGHRLAAVVSFGMATNDDGPLGLLDSPTNKGISDSYAVTAYTPMISIHGGTDEDSSHVLLPVVEGTFGGAEPAIAYPPRPFVPIVGSEDSLP